MDPVAGAVKIWLAAGQAFDPAPASHLLGASAAALTAGLDWP
ncbi:MAG: hypothetical protein ACR2MO_15585 [Acidimicrobiales bacterium]